MGNPLSDFIFAPHDGFTGSVTPQSVPIPKGNDQPISMDKRTGKITNVGPAQPMVLQPIPRDKIWGGGPPPPSTPQDKAKGGRVQVKKKPNW